MPPDPTLVYDEQYGFITRVQRAAYRKYNVSPADHTLLVLEFGDKQDGAIVNAVVDRSPNGYYAPGVGW